MNDQKETPICPKCKIGKEIEIQKPNEFATDYVFSCGSVFKTKHKGETVSFFWVYGCTMKVKEVK